MASRENEGCQRRTLASGMTSGGLRLARKSCGERKTEENHSPGSENKTDIEALSSLSPCDGSGQSVSGSGETVFFV